MTNERYWVIGGDYSCMGFKQLKGEAEVAGPFHDRDDAKAKWMELSRATSGRANARYSIATEALRTAI